MSDKTTFFIMSFVFSPIIFWDIRCVIYFLRQMIYLKKDWEYAGRLSFLITFLGLTFLYMYTQAYMELDLGAYCRMVVGFLTLLSLLYISYFYYRRKKTPEQREKDKRDPLNRQEVLSDAGKVLSKGFDNYRKM